MKTQLVHLETHDDLISIRDKMAWAKTPRILLVWPAGQTVEVRPLDLQLLRRHAAALGAELGLVTHDAEMRATARQMNLPVFATPGEAQRLRWPVHAALRPKRRFARPNLRAMRASLPQPELIDTSDDPPSRLTLFAMGVLSVLAIVLAFVPSAEVRIVAPTQTQSVDIAVSADTKATRVSLSGVVPAQALTFDVEMSDSILSSGQTVSPDQTAQGEVQFSGQGAAAIQVPAGTVLLTGGDPPVRFETVDAVEVPGTGGQPVTAAVHALAPGSAGNVPAGAITAFEGPLGLSLTVTNPSPTSGGTDVTTASPTDADRQALHERLLAQVKDHARSQLSSHLQEGDVLFPSSFAFVKVLGETYTPEAGRPGGKLTLTLRAQFHTYYAAAVDLKLLAARVLNASMPAGVAYQALDETLTVKPSTALFGGPDGNMRWHMLATRTLRARIDPAQVIFLVQGKTVRNAGSLLQQTYGLETPAQINVQPFFWPWLPALPFRITVAG